MVDCWFCEILVLREGLFVVMIFVDNVCILVVEKWRFCGLMMYCFICDYDKIVGYFLERREMGLNCVVYIMYFVF